MRILVVYVDHEALLIITHNIASVIKPRNRTVKASILRIIVIMSKHILVFRKPPVVVC